MITLQQGVALLGLLLSLVLAIEWVWERAAAPTPRHVTTTEPPAHVRVVPSVIDWEERGWL